jgi:hypothetical protein
MTQPTTRQEFADRCLRKLGFPVVEINVDEDQVADRVDDAIAMYWKFHHDGVEKLYLKHQITSNDISNTYIYIPAPVISVTKIFPIADMSQTVNMFDLRYQLRLNDLWDISSTSYVNYEITMMHMQTLEQLFSGLPGVRYNKNTSKLHLDIDWASDISEGEWVIVEAYAYIDPDEYSKLWQDKWLFDYSTALIKQQWGTNLKKFSNVPLMGGVMLDGKTIYDEATQEIEKLELQLRDEYEEPPKFICG